MKIFSKYSPRKTSPARRRTILALSLCAVVGASAAAVADVRVNPYTDNIAANRQPKSVPSYARGPAPTQSKVTRKARPQRLPTVDAGKAANAHQSATVAAKQTIVLPPQPDRLPPQPDRASEATSVQLSMPATTQAKTQRPTRLGGARPRIAASGTADLATDNLTTARLGAPELITPANPPTSSLPNPYTVLPPTPLKDTLASTPSGRTDDNIVPPPALTKRQSVAWLRSSSAASQQDEAVRELEQAMQEYRVGAWASAEASAWNSLRRSAEAIDIASRTNQSIDPRAGAADDLRIARTAIREALDFSGAYGDLNAESVKRISRSHRSGIITGDGQNISATDAIDQYLNKARVRLSRLATSRVEAAQAMDLLAAIHLGRNEPRSLPSETALCLRRAALQGQPGNGSLALRLGMQLADLGLDQEARWALQHSMAIEPTREAAQTLAAVLQRGGDRAAAMEYTEQAQRFTAKDASPSPRVPKVEHLTPEQFASVSPSFIPQTQRPVQASGDALPDQGKSASVQPVSYQPEPGSDQESGPHDKPTESNRLKSAAKRLFSPLKKLW